MFSTRKEAVTLRERVYVRWRVYSIRASSYSHLRPTHTGRDAAMRHEFSISIEADKFINDIKFRKLYAMNTRAVKINRPVTVK